MKKDKLNKDGFLIELKDGGIVDYDLSFSCEYKSNSPCYIYSFDIILSQYEIVIELWKGNQYPFSGDDFVKLLFFNYILYKNMTEKDFCEYVCRFMKNYYYTDEYVVRIKDMKLLQNDEIKGSEYIEGAN